MDQDVAEHVVLRRAAVKFNLSEWLNLKYKEEFMISKKDIIDLYKLRISQLSETIDKLETAPKLEDQNKEKLNLAKERISKKYDKKAVYTWYCDETNSEISFESFLELLKEEDNDS